MAKLKKRSKLSQQRHKNNQLLNGNGSNNTGNSRKAENQTNKVIALLDKIRKSSLTSVNDKLITINAILVQCNNDESMRKLFLKNDLIKILLNDLLKDNKHDDEILVSSLDLLKHLIMEEDYDLSIYLWRNGIWDILTENFTKAFKSLSHLNDPNVNQISKDLLLSFITNLIGVLDNLIMELDVETVNSSVVPNLVSSNILDQLFAFLNENDNINKFKNSIILNALQFVYDLSSISVEFLKTYLLNNTNFQLAFENLLQFENNLPLSKIYLLGIKLQILEIKDDLDENLNPIVDQIFSILNSIDFKDSNNDDEFQIIDISLDLLTTIIEIKGSILLENDLKKDPLFDSNCKDSILPFLGKLFEIGFNNNKKLVCLNNLIIYLYSNQLIDEKLINDLELLHTSKISNDFSVLLNSKSKDLQLIVDYLNFKLSLIEIEPLKYSQQESQINELINLGVNSLNFNDQFVDVDIDLEIQFITTLLMYLSIIAKNINNLEVTKLIVEFIIKYNLLETINFYNKKLSSDGLNISKFHKQYKYLVEETINIAINSIFELFDDDYSYNKALYHDGNLENILTNVLSDYKKIYKNIDKNVNLSLKRQSEETLNNLQRFIEYKKTE